MFFFRKYGKKTHNDEESEIEDSAATGETERSLINLKSVMTRSPKIVLRRISTLMYPGGEKSGSSSRMEADNLRPMTPRNLKFSRCPGSKQRHETSPVPGPSCSSPRKS